MLKLLYHRIFTIKNVELLTIILLCITAVGMPLSRFMMSFGTVAVAIEWVISGNWKYKFNNLKQNLFLWPIMALLVLHLLWLGRTANFSIALHDFSGKLPLLFFPLIIGSLQLSRKQMLIILQVFVAAVVISTLVSLCVHLGIYVPKRKPVVNYRDISIFVSHIRLGIMCVMSVCIMIYIWLEPSITLKRWHKVLIVVTSAWLLYFTTLIQAATSWVATLAAIVVLIVVKRQYIKQWIYYSVLAVIVAGIVITVLFVRNIYNNMNHIRDTNDNPPELTQQGNRYEHNMRSDFTENGYYVYRYVCLEELEKEWNKRSSIAFGNIDGKGHPIKNSLMRYMTSKGLPKDSCGVWQLTEKDIKGIENGFTNYICTEKSRIYNRIYEVIWEFDRYLNHNDPNGKSVCMRIEFFKAGMHIIKKHPWLGVGTGGNVEAFPQAYEEINSPLYEEYRFYAHNQYLTFIITLGFIGFVLAIICMIAPLFMAKSSDFLLVTFCTIMFVSMLDEDTLTRQLGCIMFAMLYALALMLAKNKSDGSSKTAES